jgi:hypothetical protein
MLSSYCLHLCVSLCLPAITLLRSCLSRGFSPEALDKRCDITSIAILWERKEQITKSVIRTRRKQLLSNTGTQHEKVQHQQQAGRQREAMREYQIL